MRRMRIARTLTLGGIWTYLFAKKVLPFLQERSDLPFSFKTWHAQKQAFISGNWRIDSLEDLTLFFTPIAVIVAWFLGWIIACHIPYQKIVKLFFKLLGKIFKTTFQIKPKLVLHRKGLKKPISLMPQFVGARRAGAPIANSVQAPEATPKQEVPFQQKTEETPASQTSSTADANTKLVNVRSSPILQKTTDIARAHGFRVFANLSMVDQKLPLSCAWRENAVLFNIIDSAEDDWVVEDSDDCTEAQWFSGTSYMASPCLPLLKIKEALLQKNAGLKVFCVLILAKGTIMEEENVAESLKEQGVFLVCLDDDVDSDLPPLDDFFTHTFPAAKGAA